jgi:hypothetical protein
LTLKKETLVCIQSFAGSKSYTTEAKQQRCTRASSCGASEAPPHENETRLGRPEPKLNTYAFLSSRSKLGGYSLKMKFDI